jgi:hypothetical protein
MAHPKRRNQIPGSRVFFEMSGARYSVTRWRKSVSSFGAISAVSIHFARCLRAACRGMGGNVVKITIEHPGACRDLGDLVDTRVVSIEVV